MAGSPDYLKIIVDIETDKARMNVDALRAALSGATREIETTGKTDVGLYNSLLNALSKAQEKLAFFERFVKDTASGVVRSVFEIDRALAKMGSGMILPTGSTLKTSNAMAGAVGLTGVAGQSYSQYLQSSIAQQAAALRITDQAKAQLANVQNNNFLAGISGAAQVRMDQWSNRTAILAQNAIATANANQKLNESIGAIAVSSQNATTSSMSMFSSFVWGTLAVNALYSAFGLLTKGIKDSIETVDKMRLSAASMAGAMQISQPSFGLERSLKNAKELVQMSFAMTPGFVGNARELQILTEAAVTFGLQLDFTTKKGQDQFIAFANTMKLITQGQNFEIQAFQEIRALMQGQNFQGAMLARRLQAVGIDVQRMVPLWVQQGTVIENITTILGGYASASESIKNTWEAQRRTTESIYKLVLALGADKAYDELRVTLTAINQALLTQQGLTERGKQLVNEVAAAWLTVLDVARGLYKVGSDIYSVYSLIMLALKIIVTEMNPVTITINAVKNLFEQINMLINDLTGKKTSIFEKLGLGEDGVSTAKKGIDDIFAHLYRWLSAMATGAAVGAAIGAVKGGMAGAAVGGIAGAALGLGAVGIVDLGKDQRETEKQIQLEKQRAAILEGITQLYPGQAERMRELTAEIDAGVKSTTAMGREELKRVNEQKANTDMALTLRRESLMPQSDGITGSTGGIRSGLGPGAVVGMPFSPGAAQVPEDKQLTERIEAFKKNIERNIAKLRGDIAENIATVPGSIEAEVIKARNGIKEALQGLLDNKTWEDLEKEDPKVAKRLRDTLKSVASKAESTIELKIRYKFADEMAQEGTSISNFIAEWNDKVAEITDTGGEKVERSAKSASDKVNKAFREYMSSKKFKEYLAAIGAIAEADLVEALNKLQQVASETIGKDAGAKVNITEQTLLLNASIKVDNLRREIEAMRREAEIPVKWSWNENEVERMTLFLKNDLQLEKELDRVRSARKLHEIDSKQGMSKKEADLEEKKARLAHSATSKKIMEETDTTTKYMSEAYAQAFSDIRASFAVMFGDVLRGEMQSFSDYVWSITNAIRNAWANMVAGMVTEWIKGQATMANAKAVYNAVTNWLTPAAPAAMAAVMVAKGGVFSDITPFAKGGVVHQPTLFRFAQGTGLMGEAGSEAILPLGRTPSGDLGVKSSGGKAGSQNVKVEIINPQGMPMKATDTKVKFNGQEMVVSVWLDAFNRNAYGLRSALGA